MHYMFLGFLSGGRSMHVQRLLGQSEGRISIKVAVCEVVIHENFVG